MASKLLSARPRPGFDNFVHETVTLGSKTTVATGCMLGRGSSLGDRCTIKRSVLGANCTLGANVKLINSVVMDRVTIGDGCQVQNCILCSGAHLQVLLPCSQIPAHNIAELATVLPLRDAAAASSTWVFGICFSGSSRKAILTA